MGRGGRGRVPSGRSSSTGGVIWVGTRAGVEECSRRRLLYVSQIQTMARPAAQARLSSHVSSCVKIHQTVERTERWGGGCQPVSQGRALWGSNQRRTKGILDETH